MSICYVCNFYIYSRYFSNHATQYYLQRTCRYLALLFVENIHYIFGKDVIKKWRYLPNRTPDCSDPDRPLSPTTPYSSGLQKLPYYSWQAVQLMHFIKPLKNDIVFILQVNQTFSDQLGFQSAIAKVRYSQGPLEPGSVIAFLYIHTCPSCNWS